MAVFDLLRKQDLSASEIRAIKEVAQGLLARLKDAPLRVESWRDKEATRDAVQIRDYLWSDDTGLPVQAYSEDDVAQRSAEVYRHVFRVYPTLPSPFYGRGAA